MTIYNDPNTETAADLALLGLGHADEFVRVASAISLLDLLDEISLPFGHLVDVASDHIDPLAGELAELAIKRSMLSTHQEAMMRTSPPGRVAEGGTQTCSLLVHGSQFGFVGEPIGDWWRPGGDFHSYIKENHRSDLYSKPDYYSWSGGWSDHARKLAAIDLWQWAKKRRLSNIDVLAHSHGGNVAMWATQLGLELNNLILLSCPEHLHFYQPEFSRVKRIISYQIKMDWVVIADGGGLYFNHSKIIDVALPKWFRRHRDTHTPAIWAKYELAV